MPLDKNKRIRRKYDASFKQDIIKLILLGRPISEVSQSFGLSASLVHRWYKVATAASDPKINRETSPLAAINSLAEMEHLRAELRRSEQERDILKKALDFFRRVD